ncbi:MAG: ATP-binding protein [Verrucomicrobia bacterium]|nr:ATP-binding protein [Verrucomicrobiota bacterium]
MKSDLPAPHLETCILSRPELLAPVRAMLEELAARIGFDETACGHLALAIDEALTNIIRHGYNNDPDQNIWISAWELSDPTGLRIQIDDLAPQVEVSQLKGRDLDDIRPGGLAFPDGSCPVLQTTPRGHATGRRKVPPRQNHLSFVTKLSTPKTTRAYY